MADEIYEETDLHGSIQSEGGSEPRRRLLDLLMRNGDTVRLPSGVQFAGVSDCGNSGGAMNLSSARVEFEGEGGACGRGLGQIDALNNERWKRCV